MCLLLDFFLAVPALSCDTWDLWSSLQHAWSLIVACELKSPDQGSNLYPLHRECGVLGTGPLRKSWKIDFDQQSFSEHVELGFSE